MSNSKVREFDLPHANEILEEYSKSWSTVDSGNLFFAATEYQGAYRQLQSVLLRKDMALARVMAECEVSTDRAFYTHIKSKVDRILETGK